MNKKESVIRIKYRKDCFKEVLTAVRAIEKEYNSPVSVKTNFGGMEIKENGKQKETEIVKTGDEEIIYRKSDDEEKDVEMKEVMVDMTEENDDVDSLKSLCLLLQVQPNPVNINTLNNNYNNDDNSYDNNNNNYYYYNNNNNYYYYYYYNYNNNYNNNNYYYYHYYYYYNNNYDNKKKSKIVERRLEILIFLIYF